MEYEIQYEVRECTEQFKRRFPEARKWIDHIEIAIAPLDGRADYLAALTARIGALPKEYSSDTQGEVFCGTNGYVIVIYPENIRWYSEMRFVICHELGHVHSNIINQTVEEECFRDMREQRDTPMRSGGSIWSEFIADAIAYKVTGEQYREYELYDLQNFMRNLRDRAFDRIGVIPGELAHFASFVLCVSRLRKRFLNNKNRLPEMAGYPDSIIEAVCRLLDALNEQLNEADFVVISRERMVQFGMLVDELWDICQGR